MNTRLDTPWIALRLGIGLTALLAGLDKYFNVLTHWTAYISPAALAVLPISAVTLMHIVGVVEVAVGLAVLTRWTGIGAYAASAWLFAVAGNLVLAGYYDVAVRDVVLSLSAFTLGRLTEVREHAPARIPPVSADPVGRRATA